MNGSDVPAAICWLLLLGVQVIAVPDIVFFHPEGFVAVTELNPAAFRYTCEMPPGESQELVRVRVKEFTAL